MTYIDRPIGPDHEDKYGDCEECGRQFFTGELDLVGQRFLCNDCEKESEEE